MREKIKRIVMDFNEEWFILQTEFLVFKLYK